ncbi:glycosyltransferase family 4 protein [Sphingomonas sp.]|uniref:glycosyltransferase family 4 protein n=1 Tax=Sphingomonas sp. TaxID=28214 RepID=UPI0035C86CCE
MAILLDGRPIRVPVSGVARYCLSLANALVRLRDGGALAGMPPSDVPLPGELVPDVLVQSARGTNATLGALDPRLRTIELTAFGRSRKTQNLVTEFLPALAATTVLKRYELVHETYFANLAHTPRQRKVATIHDVIPLDHPHFFSRNNRLLARRNLFRQVRLSDAVIAVSHHTKRRIVELTGCAPDHVSVIGCGVDATDAEQARAARWPIAGKLAVDDDYCLYVGNLEPRKNLGALIDAWDALAPRHRGVKLAVAGTFNYRAEPIVARGQERLGDRFVYLGPVSEADKWAALSRARALVLPSLYEGYGIPIIEAYVADTLALFSRTSSMTELALDERQMFDPTNVSAMAAVIDHALDDPAWTGAVRARARDWVAGQSWTRVARDVANIYQRVLAR